MPRRLVTLLTALLVVTQCLSSALSEALSPGYFLDPAAVTHQLGSLFSDDFEYTDAESGRTDSYTCYVYEQPADLDAFIRDYRAQMSADYRYETYLGAIDGQPCLWFTRGDGRSFLFYDYQGRMLLMSPSRFGFEPLDHVEPLPTPTPVPTATPVPAAKPQPVITPEPLMNDGPEGDWRWVEVEVDCPSCVGGNCPICHGMGYTSLYGQRVDCDKRCSACDGKGTFTQSQYHFFPAGSDSWLY